MIKEALRFRANASFTSVFLVSVLVAGCPFLNSKINCRFLFQHKNLKDLGVPLRVGLSAASPRCAVGFPLQSLTQDLSRAVNTNF